MKDTPHSPPSRPPKLHTPGSSENSDELGRLLQRLRSDLIKYATKKGLSKADATDTVDKLLGKVLLKGLDHVEESRIRAYLFRATRNNVLNHHRDIGRRKTYTEAGLTPPDGQPPLLFVEESTADQEASRKSTGAILAVCLSRLQREDKENRPHAGPSDYVLTREDFYSLWSRHRYSDVPEMLDGMMRSLARSRPEYASGVLLLALEGAIDRRLRKTQGFVELRRRAHSCHRQIKKKLNEIGTQQGWGEDWWTDLRPDIR